MTDPSQQQPRPRPYLWLFGNLRQRWPILDFYERFEQIVSLVLSFFLILVILSALRVWPRKSMDSSSMVRCPALPGTPSPSSSAMS
ncbi:hypothetical protein [Acidithiobacillus sulfuriphilus]|uniref:hypothetical protein n=1 Tax=Acidithiobacillus sulfuriphilus TaxID=1867749 RepID=UPI003F641200